MSQISTEFVLKT